MESCISTKKFWEQVFLGFQGKNHLFQRKSGCSDFAQVFPDGHVTNRKSFLNKFFLDFMEKITCSNVKAAVQILLEYSPTVT
jgi:hypothetical protein